MKITRLTFLLFVVISSSCGLSAGKSNTSNDDKAEVRDLVIQVLKWHERNGVFNGFVPIFNANDSLAIGMDLKVLQDALDNFAESKLLDKKFINNYIIILTSMVKKIKKRKMVFMEEVMLPNEGSIRC